MGVFAGPEIVEDGLVLALDAGNNKSYSQNEFEYSTDIFGWFSGNSGGVNAATVSRDVISSPVGNTPLKMEVTGNDPHLGSYNAAKWNIAPASNGQTWIVSVYVRANVATTGEILIFGANSSGAAFVDGGWLSLTGTTVNIGTEWTRVQHVHTMNNANVAYIHMRLDGPHSGGTGQTIWWDGLQVERVPSGTTTPTPFTSSYYGGSVFRDLSGSNNGTLVNYPTYSSANGGSLSFDGVNDYISASLNNPGGDWIHSIEFWMYMNQNQSAISSRQDPFQIGTPATSQYSAVDISNNNFNWYFYSNDCRVTTNLFVANTWYYIGLTYTGGGATSTNKQLYVNGVNVPFNTSGSANLNIPANSTLSIGRDGGRTTAYFNGRISNFKIYNKALTASEIQQNFNAIRSRFGI